MEPETNRFGGGASESILHPLVLVAMLIAVVLILCLRRKHIIIPLLLGVLLIPKAQVLVIGGAHFTVARILFLVGLVRWVGLAGMLRPVRGYSIIDRAFVAWATSYLIIYSIQWFEVQALIKALGEFLDAVGGYFVLRFAIRNEEDVNRAIRILGFVAVVCAATMVIQQITRINVFGLLGGMSVLSAVRDGKIRSQGPFAQFLLAGSYGATILPLLLWLSSKAKRRFAGYVGIVAATTMVVTCGTSTALITYACGVLALLLWPLRKQMQLVRWGIVCCLTGLHMVMNGPVWSLIQKIDLTGSSSSYHRYKLVDNCIRHFGDWWLLGYRYYNTWGWSMWDLANQYVAYAVTGGLVTVACFIAIICCGFSRIGRARLRVQGDVKAEWGIWCLGSAMFAHVVAYFGIGYWDQMQFAWFALLAIIGVQTTSVVIGSSVAPSLEMKLHERVVEQSRL